MIMVLLKLLRDLGLFLLLSWGVGGVVKEMFNFVEGRRRGGLLLVLSGIVYLCKR